MYVHFFIDVYIYILECKLLLLCSITSIQLEIANWRLYNLGDKTNVACSCVTDITKRFCCYLCLLCVCVHDMSMFVCVCFSLMKQCFEALSSLFVHECVCVCAYVSSHGKAHAEKIIFLLFLTTSFQFHCECITDRMFYSLISVDLQFSKYSYSFWGKCIQRKMCG